jgi:hypothetical protein
VPQNTFTVDKIALFYNAQHDSILAIKGETCHGGRKYRDGQTGPPFNTVGHE